MKNVVNLRDLHKAVGDEAFGIMTKKYRGMHLYFHKNFNAEYYNKKERNKEIIEDYNSGMTADDLSVKYELTRGTIYKILEKMRR